MVSPPAKNAPPPPDFGPALHASHFPHRPSDFLHTNHGSFGSAPTKVLEEWHRLQALWQSAPDRFWTEELKLRFDEARAVVADKVLGCDVERVTLVDNATTAANIVALKVAWEAIQASKAGHPAPVVLLTNSTYGAVKMAFEAYAGRAGAVIETWNCPFPCYDPRQIVSAFQNKLQELGSRVSMVVLDHIVSETALLMPLESLVAEARRAGVREIFVDGAHAAGQIDLVGLPTRLGITYYTANLHKWMQGATGSALFYFDPKADLHHPVVSWSAGMGLAQESAMLATRDYSAMLCVGSAVDFHQWLGPQRARDYVKEEAWAAASMLAKKWGTKVGQAPELAAGMVMVELPRNVQHGEPIDLRKKLRAMGIEIQTPLVAAGTWWVRISVPVWMKADEFGELGDVVLKLSTSQRL